MSKWLRVLCLVLIVGAPCFAAKPCPYPAKGGFTGCSSFNFYLGANGFDLGFEQEPNHPSGEDTASWTQDILAVETGAPVYPKKLNFAGSLSFQPKVPVEHKGCWLLCAPELRVFVAADLVRVWIHGCWQDTPTGPLYPIRKMILNVDQKVISNPDNYIVQWKPDGWQMPMACAPGQPLQIEVEFGQAGTGNLTGLELQLYGEWE